MADPLGNDILREYRESAGIPDRTTTAETSLAQGLRSGVFGAGSQLQALTGGVAEALGFDEFADERYAASQRMSEQAQRFAPPVSHSSQVDGVSNALRYVGGLTGQMLPVAAGQIGATLLAPASLPARIVAGAGVAAPFEVGDVIQRQQQDPVSLRESAADRLGAAVLTGGASALAQGVVPAIVGGQLAGATAREALRRPAGEIGLRALGNTALESATEAGGETVKQTGMRLTNPDAQFDIDQIIESGIAGAAAGAPLAGVGAAGEFAQGRVRGAVDAAQALPGKVSDAVGRLRGSEPVQAAEAFVGEQAGRMREAVGGAADRVRSAVDKGKPEGGGEPPGSPGGILSRLRGLYDDGKAQATRAANRMARGDEFVEPERFAGAQGERLKQAVAEDDASSLQRAQQWVQDLSQKTLSAEKRAALQQAATDLSSRANRATVAALKRGQDMAAEAQAATGRLVEQLRGQVEKTASKVRGKRSEDYSGLRAKILETVVPAIRQHNPDLLDNTKALQDVAEALRLFLQLAAVKRTNELPQGAIDDLATALGPNVVQVMGQVHEAVGGLDAQQSERLYDTLNKLGEAQRGRQTLTDVMMQNLRPELQDSVTTSGVRQEAEVLRRWARGLDLLPKRPGGGLSSAKDEFQNQRVREMLTERYGGKADAVLAAVEAELKQERTIFDLNEDAPDANPELDADEQALDAGDRTLREGSVGDATSRIVTTAQGGRLYRRPDIDVGEGGNDPPSVQALAKARERNPGYEVRFETADKLDFNDEMVQRHITQRAKDLIAESDGTLTAEAARAQAVAELKDFGVVVAEATRQETALSSREIESIKLDTKKHSKSPSRIDVGEGKDKMALDAVKLTALMHERASRPEDYTESDDKSSLHRDARMFLDGVAALQDRFGAFAVPDTLVFNRGGATVAEIRSLSFSTETRDGRTEMPTENELEQQIKKLRQEYRAKAEKGASESDLGKIKARGDTLKARLADVRAQALRASADEKDSIRAANPRGQVGETLQGRGQLRADERGNVEVVDPGADDARLLVDEAGQPLDKPRGTVPPLQRMADEMRASTVAAQRALGEKLAGLLALGPAVERAGRQVSGLSPKDKGLLDSIAGIVKVSDRAGPINALAKKYGVQAGADTRLEAQVEGVLRNVKPKKAAAPEVAAKSPKEQLLARARSADSSFLERVASSSDAKGLQRAAAELAEAGGADQALAAINERLGVLVQNPDVAYGLQTRKYSLLSTQIHVELGRDGFPAAHDSPIKHAGNFDWRKNMGRADAGAAKGAGTYLSSGEGTHRYYKARSTAQRGETSPTYHVSVRATPDELFAWDTPIADQPALKAVYDRLDSDQRDGVAETDTAEFLYRQLTKVLGGKRDASEFLQEQGLVGHSYKDSKGFDNYVIYDDSRIVTNFTSFSLQGVTPGANGPVDRKEVLDYIKRVLGDSVRVAWADLNYAGDFTREGGANNAPIEDVIRLSVHALNPKSVAYHEALHAFFQKLADTRNSRAAAVIMKAASTPAMQRRLRELLKDEPAALAQLTDAEERAAYMYQFWAAGVDLPLGDTPKTWLGKIAELLRKVLGTWSNDERALHILDYFHSGQYAANMGDPNAVAKALFAPGTNRALEQAKLFTQPLLRFGEKLAVAGGERLRDTEIPALVELADTMKRKLTKEGEDAGYLPAARLERTRVMNDFAAALRDYSVDDIAAATEAMQRSEKASGKARQVQVILQGTDGRGGMFGKLFDYMRGAGVDIAKLGGKDPKAYFPRVWDVSYIGENQQQFLNMLEQYKQRGLFTGDPKKLLNDLIVSEGAEFTVEVDRPGMQFGKRRKLDFIEPGDAAPFLRKNLFEIMNSYVTQATRRAEWARRLGDDGAKVADLLDRAREQGATPEQINDAKKFIRSVDGTLGDEIRPEMRRLFGNVMVYQNIRLLPLAVFSSIVDSLGVVVRGGTVGDAFTTFKRGMRETVKNFQKNPKTDLQTEMAQMLGVIDNAALTHAVGALYSQGMVGDTGRKINDAFFRYNLLEQFNRSMRVGATQAAIGFIKRHAAGADPQHSERFLRELGLEARDVKVDSNGYMLLTEADGLTTAQAAKLRMAINRWVDGAVLRPDAVDKPFWMNDPMYALVAHLKSFVFSFQETILKRVVHEYRNGNYRPAMALASYVPFMIASDVVKGFITTGGEEPAWKREWGVTDYVWSGVQRGGLLGVGQFGADAFGNVQRGGAGFGALVGPTFEQLGDAVETTAGVKQFDSFLLKSMPANALYAEAFRGEPAEARTE